MIPRFVRFVRRSSMSMIETSCTSMTNQMESSPMSGWQGVLCGCLYQRASSSWNCSSESKNASHRWTRMSSVDAGGIAISLVERDYLTDCLG